ncbi:MAG: hypothetical protein IKS31_04310 [Clostridia bacterium]|nr:hypothetical protein [Clostridia bacterium]
METPDLVKLKRRIVGLQRDKQVFYPDRLSFQQDERAVYNRETELFERLDEKKVLMTLHLEPKSDKPLIGGASNLFKRFLARYLRWFHLPVMERQSEVNVLLVEEVRRLRNQVKGLQDELARIETEREEEQE